MLCKLLFILFVSYLYFIVFKYFILLIFFFITKNNILIYLKLLKSDFFVNFKKNINIII